MLKDYVLHLMAAAIAIFSAIRILPLFPVFEAALIFLFAFIACKAYKSRKEKKKEKFSRLYFIYLLMFGLAIISNMLEFLAFFTPTLGLVIYCISIPLFIFVLYKVLNELRLR